MSYNKIYTTIGLMSGTSIDSIDAALLRTDGQNHIEVIGGIEHPYTNDERKTIRKALGQKSRNHADVKIAEKVITNTHIDAVRNLLTASGMSAYNIDYIGFHGQTIYHAPHERITIQIGDAGKLTNETGIKTIYDFRTNDVNAGGQGAPFLPLYHAARLSDYDGNMPVAILNLGGVGNITWINKNTNTITAFDTGPANALMDDFVSKNFNQKFDNGGNLAAKGHTNLKYVDEFIAHPYFQVLPPKSLDRDQFQDFLRKIKELSPHDGLATLAHCTIQSIVKSFEHVPQKPDTMFVTGGGRHNTFIMKNLANALQIPVNTVENLNWNGDFLEAEGFAYLAVRHVLNLPLSLPSTTGVPQPMQGGKLYAEQ